jgi:hypothetical protein
MLGHPEQASQKASATALRRPFEIVRHERPAGMSGVRKEPQWQGSTGCAVADGCCAAGGDSFAVLMTG